MKMLDYAGNEMEFEACPSCEFAKHKFTLPCGMAYEDKLFTVSQDWELPIKGFFVIMPKRCVESLSELTEEERVEAFSLANEVIKILKSNNICDRFNVLFEEKQNRHFHIWIMPRHKWMQELVGGITKNIGKIFEYALNNLRTEENIKAISDITKIVKTGLERFNDKGDANDERFDEK